MVAAPLWCGLLTLALFAGGAAGLRQDAGRSRAALPRALLQDGGEGPAEARADEVAAGAGGRTPAASAASPPRAGAAEGPAAHPDAAPAASWHGLALPQTFAGEDLGRWLIRAAIQKKTLIWICIIETIILVFTVGGPAMIYCMTRMLGNAVEAGIETFDKTLIGADVEIGRITPNIVYGILDIDEFMVKNPDDKGYDSPYLLKAKRVHIDLDMAQLFLSCFKRVTIEKVVFKDVDVIFEKHYRSSNVQDILAFLSGTKDDKKGTKKGDAEKEPPEAASPVAASSPKAKEASPGNAKDPKAASPKVDEPAPPAHDLQVTLHEVCIEDVGARAQAKMLGGRGFRMAISDIYFKDFSQEANVALIDDVIIFLLKSFLKTVLANVVGKKFGDQCM